MLVRRATRVAGADLGGPAQRPTDPDRRRPRDDGCRDCMGRDPAGAQPRGSRPRNRGRARRRRGLPRRAGQGGAADPPADPGGRRQGPRRAVRGRLAPVPAGTLILIDAWGVHHDPDRHPDPERFRPERFLSESPEPYSWLPFGGGAHRCIGAALAELEIKIALSTMLTRVDISPADPSLRRLGAGGSRSSRTAAGASRSKRTLLRSPDPGRRSYAGIRPAQRKNGGFSSPAPSAGPGSR